MHLFTQNLVKLFVCRAGSFDFIKKRFDWKWMRERESERASERTRERERERKWESEREERESERTRARARERESEKDYAEYAINNSILINVNEWKTLIFTEIIIWISINLMPWNERKINTSVTKTIFFFYFLILNSWKSDIFCGSLKNWIED